MMTKLQENLFKSQGDAWFLIQHLKDVYKELPEKEIQDLIKQAEAMEKRVRILQEQHSQN